MQRWLKNRCGVVARFERHACAVKAAVRKKRAPPRYGEGGGMVQNNRSPQVRALGLFRVCGRELPKRGVTGWAAVVTGEAGFALGEERSLRLRGRSAAGRAARSALPMSSTRTHPELDQPGSAAPNPAPAVAPAPLAAPSPPTIKPATSPAHIGKVAVEAGDHALGGCRSERGGRGRGARREQKSCKPERNDGFLHDSSPPSRR
jgi:hypothetical protein